MTGAPPTRYARTAEGAYLAYQIAGDGPIDVVLAPAGGVPIDLMWDEPAIAACLGRLASFSRLITFDPRAFGSSTRVDPATMPAIQVWMDDLATVLDAAGSERAAFITWGEPSVSALMFAATFPQRVAALILVNGYARYTRSDDCPWGMPGARLETYGDIIERLWGTGEITRTLAPSLVSTDDQLGRVARLERLSASPEAVRATSGAFMRSDVTDVLPTIQVPTLVISRQGDRHVRPEHSRYLASRIPGARLVELPGDDHMLFGGEIEELLDETQEFCTGVRPSAVLDRVLATVLFTDIVGSTERAAQVGDHRWRESLNRYDELVLRQLERFRGRQVKTTGDGTLATFDGPARAIECARSVAEAVRTLGLEIRAGLHTGEVETRGQDVAGVAVHIASRVSGLAGPGEVLVSRTVTDLVAGSGIRFEDRGDHELKGVPGTWRLFSVSAA